MPKRIIALDIMSGDESPRSRIQAACSALKKYPHLHLILVGDQHLIQSTLLQQTYAADRFSVVHAPNVIAMDMKPSRALRNRVGSSLWHTIEQVAQQHASACVSAGNTGALMAMGRKQLKTFAGVDRPAIAGTLPCKHGRVLLLDMGANVDCTAEQLWQFAVMGSQLVTAIHNVNAPTVGLLNVGVESIKGTEQVQQAHELLSREPSLNYVGFVEGHDIFNGEVDIIVCDGFAGNVALKASEGMARFIGGVIYSAFTRRWWRRMLFALCAPVLKKLYQQMDPGSYNGASLLGLQGIVIKSHGNADAAAFLVAIEEALKEIEHNVPAQLAQLLQQHQDNNGRL